MNHVEEKVIDILGELGVVKVENMDQSLKEDLGINSLNTVMMIVAME